MDMCIRSWASLTRRSVSAWMVWSKSHLMQVFVEGMVLSGPKTAVKGHIEGLNMSNMRLCPPFGPSRLYKLRECHQSVDEFVLPGGRLRAKKLYLYAIQDIPGLIWQSVEGGPLYSKNRPQYVPHRVMTNSRVPISWSRKRFSWFMVGFNWKEPDHFRVSLYLSSCGRIGANQEKKTHRLLSRR